MVRDEEDLDARLVPASLEHREHEVVVGARLVHEARPPPVHRDHAGLAAIDEVREGLRRAPGPGNEGDRSPRRGLAGIRRERGSRLARDPDSVPGVPLGRKGVMVLAGADMRIVALLHCLVRGKPAAGEHHPARRMHFDRLAVQVEHRATHPGVLPEQSGHRRGQEHRHPTLLEGEGEARDERVAVCDARAAGMPDPVEEMPEEETPDVEGGPERTGHAQEVRHVLARDAHAAHDHRGLERAAQVREVRAEAAAVEVIHPQGTPARHRVADLRMVVRPGRGERVRDVAVRLEEVEHPRAVLDERLRKVAVETVADLVPEVGESGLARILDAGPPGMRAARDPDDAGRNRGSAAEHRLLLDHDDIEPEMSSAERGAQAPRTRADDQHVAVPGCGVGIHEPAGYHPASHPPSTYRVVPVM